jgi:hypothetical protein
LCDVGKDESARFLINEVQPENREALAPNPQKRLCFSLYKQLSAGSTRCAV